MRLDDRERVTASPVVSIIRVVAVSQVSGSRMGALWPQIQHHPAWTNQNKGATHVTVAAGVCYLQFVVVVYVFWLVWGVSGGLQPLGPNRRLREGHDRPHPNGPTRHTS